MITDAQGAKWQRIADKVHTAAKLDVAVQNQVVGDITKFAEATAPAREDLKADAQAWNVAGKGVRAGFKNAIEYDLQNVHYDPVQPGHPGSIEFTNSTQVVQHWRDAVQADQDLGQEVQKDVADYKSAIAPAKDALKNSI
jgi:gas vesicle protein